jgi:predicted nucleotidyltransferase
MREIGYASHVMISLIEQHRPALLNLCARHEVRRLELFGSAAVGKGVPNDLDFLVVFDREGAMSPADRFLGLQAALEDLFGMKVDLVDVMAHRNPYFMADALKHRVTLYAAA